MVQGGEGGRPHRLDRYDYLYDRDQLEPRMPQIKEAELKESKVRIYFNNHARGQIS
jgi:uncharacterized protein YecE (DUF72 family)